MKVTLHTDLKRITITESTGLSDRAHRDMKRLQFITIGYGWELTDRLDEFSQLYKTASAVYSPEGFKEACRYFYNFAQGIEVVIV